MKTILLTSGRIPASLELARALYQQGHRIIVAESLKTHLCLHSKAVAQCHYVRAPGADELGFREDILRLVRIEKVDLILPMCEEAIYLSRLLPMLPDSCELFCKDYALMRQVHSKWEFIELAKALRLPVPKTTLVRTRKLSPRFQKKGYVVKPVFSRSGQGVYIQDPGTPMPPDVNYEDRPWILQERLLGNQYCTFSIAHHGKVISTVIYKTRVRLGFIGACFQKVEHRKVTQWIEKFVKGTNWHGFVSFDFIEGQDQRVYAIECNPRITSGIHVMEPEKLAQSVMEPASVSPEGAFKPSRAMVAMAMITSFPAMLTRPQNWPAFISEMVRCRDVIFSLRDPIPAIHQFRCYLEYMQVSFRKNIALKDVISHEIEYQET